MATKAAFFSGKMLYNVKRASDTRSQNLNNPTTLFPFIQSQVFSKNSRPQRTALWLYHKGVKVLASPSPESASTRDIQLSKCLGASNTMPKREKTPSPSRDEPK